MAKFYYKIAWATNRATMHMVSHAIFFGAERELEFNSRKNRSSSWLLISEAAAAKNAQSSTGESKDRQSFETLVAVRLTNLINL